MQVLAVGHYETFGGRHALVNRINLEECEAFGIVGEVNVRWDIKTGSAYVLHFGTNQWTLRTKNLDLVSKVVESTCGEDRYRAFDCSTIVPHIGRRIQHKDDPCRVAILTEVKNYNVGIGRSFSITFAKLFQHWIFQDTKEPCGERY